MLDWLVSLIMMSNLIDVDGVIILYKNLPLMFKNVWSLLNDKIDVPESHILHLWLTGQQGGE